MRFHFAAGTNCQQAFQLMTLVKVCKAGLVICDYNIDNDVYDEDDDDNEVTPVPTVKVQVLKKIILWINYHKIDDVKTEKIVWYIQ